MRQALLDYLGPREERITLAGQTVVVRTLPEEADKAGFKDAGEDMIWKFVTRCTFEENGDPAFTDDDIPVLKASRPGPRFVLTQAVARVNGLDIEDEVKNSAAVPSGG